MKRRILFALFVALLTSALFLGVLYIHVRADWNAKFQSAVDLKAYRLSHPAPYADSPYWSADFVLEYDKINSHLSPNGYWLENEFHGTYYTFGADGARVVPRQPRVYKHTIWVFGNSGTMDPYVPDDYTMTAQLQTMFPNERVMNRGAGGQLVSGQVAWLKDSDIHSGDVVIFIDGGMDVQSATPLDRYWSTIKQAQDLTTKRGATFEHFIQPCYVPDYNDVLKGIHIRVPQSMFVDHGCHMNEHGDAVVAKAFYDAITLM